MTQGHFITLEGGEGSGKTTQSALLAAALKAQGHPVVQTREPGGSPGAELLRGILLGGSVDWSPQAETLLHFAARADHVARTIRPALDAGAWVVCDRFYDSTLAYQGHGQGAGTGFITEQIRLLGLDPDLTLVLDVPEAVAIERVQKRGGQADRYERLDPGFHARVRQAFRDIAAADRQRCVLVNAAPAVQPVHKVIMRSVSDRLG